MVIVVWRRPNVHASFAQEFLKIIVRCVVRLVFSFEATEILNAAEILANNQDFRFWISKPLRPIADDRRIEVKLRSILDTVGVMIAAN